MIKGELWRAVQVVKVVLTKRIKDALAPSRKRGFQCGSQCRLGITKQPLVCDNGQKVLQELAWKLRSCKETAFGERDWPLLPRYDSRSAQQVQQPRSPLPDLRQTPCLADKNSQHESEDFCQRSSRAVSGQEFGQTQTWCASHTHPRSSDESHTEESSRWSYGTIASYLRKKLCSAR